MAVSYDKLWKLLIDKKISTVKLREMTDIAPNTMTKMRKEEYVSMDVLDRICEALNVDYGDIISRIKSRG